MKKHITLFKGLTHLRACFAGWAGCQENDSFNNVKEATPAYVSVREHACGKMCTNLREDLCPHCLQWACVYVCVYTYIHIYICHKIYVCLCLCILLGGFAFS